MKTLFNPFEKYTEKQLLLFGSILMISGSLVAWMFNTRFDGILDVHFSVDVAIYQPLLDNMVNIFSAFLFLFAAACIVNKKSRMIDILSAIIISRIPIYFISLFNIGGGMSYIGEKMMGEIGKNPFTVLNGSNIMLLIFSGILSILFVIWSITLFYNGYKVGANAKGGKAIALFVVALLLSEILSKIIISII
jgi:hypothetical protein